MRLTTDNQRFVSAMNPAVLAAGSPISGTFRTVQALEDARAAVHLRVFGYRMPSYLADLTISRAKRTAVVTPMDHLSAIRAEWLATEEWWLRGWEAARAEVEAQVGPL